MEIMSTGTLSLYSESSKTGSSRSKASAASKEVDLTKDNTASPIDLECHIQAERITKILDESIYKIKLSICIPALMQEYFFLSSVLNDQHLGDLMYIFEQYENPLFSTSLHCMGAIDDIKGGDMSLKNRLNPELAHIVYILNTYPRIKPKVEELIDEMKESLQKSNGSNEKPLNTLPVAKAQPGLEFLMTFEKFRDLMVEQMELTAAEELMTKINTRRLQKSNEKLIEKIEEYKKLIKEESEHFDVKMKNKNDTIKRLEQELAFLHHDAAIGLKKKILDSDRQMVLATRAHVVKQEMLKEEETETRDAYDTLLRNHLADEKNMRARRFKVETQLLSWIQKYDLEMADKQVELDEFTEKYEDELQKCEDLDIKLAEQDIEFIPLMAEREEEYHQEMTEKMNKFLIEHAARVIQNAWREVLANRAEKKRLKKIQKKMQAAAAKPTPTKK